MVNDMHDAGQLHPDAGPIPAESKQQETSVVRTRVIPIVAGALVVGLLALLAYALFAPESLRVDAGRTVTDFGAVVYEDPRPAPSFVLGTFDGESFDLGDYIGQVVVLNFWASWCGPCIAEMPMLNRVADEFADDNVVVVGVNVWDSRDAAQRFVDELNITYLIVEDEVATSIAVEYGLTGVPETFVLNPDGEIVAFSVVSSVTPSRSET